VKIVRELIPYVVIVAIVILIRTYIITPVRVNGPSMETSLYNGDILLLEKFNNSYERFDIVVANYNNEKIIKRIIGLPGDSVKYQNNILYINGERVDEPFINELTQDFSLSKLGYDTIPEDYYFVVGDNRDNSLDSRFVGLFSKDAIDGKVIFRLFPFNRIGGLD